MNACRRALLVKVIAIVGIAAVTVTACSTASSSAAPAATRQPSASTAAAPTSPAASPSQKAVTYKPWVDASTGENTCTYTHAETGGTEVVLSMTGTLQVPQLTTCYAILNLELGETDRGAGYSLPGVWTYVPGAPPVPSGSNGCSGTVGNATVTINVSGGTPSSMEETTPWSLAMTDAEKDCDGVNLGAYS